MTTVKLTGNFLATARCLIFSDGGGVSWNFNQNTNTLTASATSGGTFLSSVGLADTSTAPIFVVTNSPLTVNGTLDITLKTQAQNLVLAGPTTGAAAQPTFRALVATDVPTLAYVTSIGTGTGLTGGPITSSGTISLANTAVTPGAYTLADITIDAQGRITAAANGTGSGSSITTLTQSGGATQNYTIPPTANFIEAILDGGGGGGGGGILNSSGTCSGGAGGGSGAKSLGIFRVADLLALGSTIAVTFSNPTTGGNGGANKTGTGTGNAGVAGSNVTFGNFLIAPGGNGGAAGIAASAPAGGTGGTPSNNANGVAGGNGGNGTAGLNGQPSTTGTTGSTGGGAGGGENTTGPTAANGGTGGANTLIANLAGGTSGTANGAGTLKNGGNGQTGSGTTSGTGGGGGGGGTGTNVGGNGGNGGGPGGGGGGGGSAQSTAANSGNGGSGAPAQIVITAW